MTSVAVLDSFENVPDPFVFLEPGPYPIRPIPTAKSRGDCGCGGRVWEPPCQRPSTRMLSPSAWVAPSTSRSAAASEADRHQQPVVTPVGASPGTEHWCLAKLAHRDDRRVVEQAALFTVGHHGGDQVGERR